MTRTLLLIACLGLTQVYAQDWKLLNPVQELTTFYDVYMDPGGFGWVVGDGGTILHTTDVGQSWTDQSDLLHGNLFHVAYVPGSNGQQVVAAGTKIVATADGGQSWQAWIPTPNAGAYQGIAAPSAQAIYITTNQGKLFKSQDGGMNFERLTTLPVEIEWTDIDFLNDSLGWLGSREGDLLRTTDGGQSWEVLHDTTFDNRIEFTWLHSQLGYMVHDRDFLRTTNGGVSWDTLAENALTFLVDDLVQVDSTTMLVTQGARISRSTDGGLTWVMEYNHPYIGTDNNALHAHPDGKVWAANKWHSLLYSDDAGGTWSDLFPGFRGFLSEVKHAGPDTVLAMGGDGMAIKTTNGGLDWEEITDQIPDQVDTRGLIMYSGEQYVVAGMDKFYTTDDGGNSWMATDSLNTGFVWQLSQKPNGELYAISSFDEVYHSADSGLSWNAEPAPAEDLRYLGWANDSLGLFSGQDGRLFRTTDGGQDWDSLASGTEQNLLNICWKSETEVFVLGRSLWDSLLYSMDAGLSWEKRALPRRAIYSAMAFADSVQGWIVGGSNPSGYIWETTDGGQSWNQVLQHTATYQALTLSRSDSVRAWAVGQGGMIRFLGSLDSTQNDTTVLAQPTALAESRWQLYPNPSQGWLSLQTPLPSSVPLSMEVYTLQGQRVQQYHWVQAPSEVNLQELPTGWYVLRLQQGAHLTYRRLRLDGRGR